MRSVLDPHPGIRIDKIPAKGGVGLVFTIGVMAMILIALPQARWFLALAIPAGIVVGLAMHFLHRFR